MNSSQDSTGIFNSWQLHRIRYILIISAIAYKLKLDWIVSNIYMVTIYHAVLRLGFNLMTGRGLLLNWNMQIAYFLVSAGSAFYVYSNLIINKAFFFPESKDIGNALWLGVIAFIYHTFNSVRLSEVKTKKRKDRYLNSVYLKYKAMYGTLISGIAEDNRQESLIYAILIHENFNRPKAFRFIENILFFVGRAKTLGIMQVTTEKYINDRQSVELGSKKIVLDYNIASNSTEARYGIWNIRRLTIKSYNPDNDYIDEVSNIDDMIFSSFYMQIAGKSTVESSNIVDSEVFVNGAEKGGSI